jgi:NHL repeat-containing protein
MKVKIFISFLLLVVCIYAQAQIITTVCGSGTGGLGDGGQATNAQLMNPAGIAFDAVGNLYIADESNPRIRKINTAGIISTIAGNGTVGYSGDGGAATLAEFTDPTGLVFDNAGNLYIADQYNYCVRKINTNGIISTIAGTGVEGYSGDGGQATVAQLSNTSGLTFDKHGNLYFGDNNNHVIRMVNTAGIITALRT